MTINVFDSTGKFDPQATRENLMKEHQRKIDDLFAQVKQLVEDLPFQLAIIQDDTKTFAEDYALFPEAVLSVWFNHFKNTEIEIPTKSLSFIAAEIVSSLRWFSRASSERHHFQERIEKFLPTFDRIELVNGDGWILKKTIQIPSSNQ